jgi:HSP20 family protein
MFEITRHDPFAIRNINELMNLIAHDPFFRGSAAAGVTETTALPVDVSEVDGDVVVRASLPGFDRKDIEIEVHDGILSIKAEHTEVKETKDEKFHQKERRFGAVQRRIALPSAVAEDKAKAELKDGVLTLRLPQARDARPKQIPIA